MSLGLIARSISGLAQALNRSPDIDVNARLGAGAMTYLVISVSMLTISTGICVALSFQPYRNRHDGSTGKALKHKWHGKLRMTLYFIATTTYLVIVFDVVPGLQIFSAHKASSASESGTTGINVYYDRVCPVNANNAASGACNSTSAFQFSKLSAMLESQELGVGVTSGSQESPLFAAIAWMFWLVLFLLCLVFVLALLRSFYHTQTAKLLLKRLKCCGSDRLDEKSSDGSDEHKLPLPTTRKILELILVIVSIVYYHLLTKADMSAVDHGRHSCQYERVLCRTIQRRQRFRACCAKRKCKSCAR